MRGKFLVAALSLAVGVLPACQGNDDPSWSIPLPQKETVYEPVPESAPQEVAPPVSPEIARVQFSSKLWETRLGRMYSALLFSPAKGENLPKRARSIADRILEDTDHTAGRVGAVQMMNEDLYAQGRVTNEVLARIALLEQEMTKGRQRVEESTALTIARQMPVFLLAFPIGSPLTRAEFQNFARGHGSRIVAWMKRKDLPPVPLVQWRRIRSKEFFKNYEIGKPVDAFYKTALPLAVYEWMSTEHKIYGTAEGLTPEEIQEEANSVIDESTVD